MVGLQKKYGTPSGNLWSPMTINGRGPRRKAWEGRRPSGRRVSGGSTVLFQQAPRLRGRKELPIPADSLGAADAVDGAGDYAAGVAGAFSAGVYTGNGYVLQGLRIAGDAYW